MIESENETEEFVRTLIERTRLVDVAVLALVPIALWLVFLWPRGVRRSLAFDYTDPSVLTAFTANFVHLGAGHLVVNVVTYALVVPVVFTLSVASGRRGRFYAAFLTFVLVFPFVLSYLNLAVVRSAVGVGFSGVVMAFVGYLPFALADALDVHFDIGSATDVAPALFFVSIALIAGLSVQSVVGDPTVLLGTSGLVLAALLSALLYALGAYDGGEGVGRKLRAAIGRAGYFELVFVGFVLFLVLPFMAFPTEPAAGDGVSNLYVHLLGYALGFMVTYATATVTARIGPGQSPV